MIVELGHLFLLLSLPLSLLLACAPVLANQFNDPRWSNLVAPCVALKFFALTLAFAALSYAFLTDDFSVNLVAQHSNTMLPAHFKFSALWGNHEGSLLLWTWILAGWTLAVLLFGRGIPGHVLHIVLAVLGLVTAGFLLFIIFTSNPFIRNLLTPPADGADLNPLLQDPGLIFHPPLLYTGYVGFAVAFAFAIAALITGRLDAAWARWSRPWTNVAWAFLTIGIALGSWWAYYELGWGGWWFWDPVENASFMPWLAGTALIHSLAVTEKRGVFRSWTVLLAILAFSLSLLGTFLVRSGILVSVHAFASDPTRGVFILVFLLVVIGGSLLLYALRAPQLSGGDGFTLWSRETALLVNNIFLSAALVVVLIGTLLPLIMNAFELGSLSIGAPYFNSFAWPLGLPMLLLMGIAPFLFWRDTPRKLIALNPVLLLLSLSLLLGLGTVLAVSRWLSAEFSLLTAIMVFASFFLIVMTMRSAYVQVSRRQSLANVSLFSLTPWLQLGRSYWGMVLAHIGMAVSVIGIALTSAYSIQKDVSMGAGDFYDIGPYRYVMQGFEDYRGPNYFATRATLNVMHGDRVIAAVFPEKRRYNVSQNIMTEAGISASLSRDLYVSLGDAIQPGVWAVSLQLKAFVRLIWLGAIFMSAGAILAVLDKRYRRQRIRTTASDIAVVLDT